MNYLEQVSSGLEQGIVVRVMGFQSLVSDLIFASDSLMPSSSNIGFQLEIQIKLSLQAKIDL